MFLKFDFGSDVPLYMQIRNQIVMGIASGKLAEGEQLPTVRSLADESGINTMTVSKAYQLLKQEGYINTDRRGGTTVCIKEKKVVSEDMLEALRLNISELRIAGLSKEEVLSLCDKVYGEAEK